VGSPEEMKQQRQQQNRYAQASSLVWHSLCVFVARLAVSLSSRPVFARSLLSHQIDVRRNFLTPYIILLHLIRPPA